MSVTAAVGDSIFFSVFNGKMKNTVHDIYEFKKHTFYSSEDGVRAHTHTHTHGA